MIITGVAVSCTVASQGEGGEWLAVGELIMLGVMIAAITVAFNCHNFIADGGFASMEAYCVGLTASVSAYVCVQLPVEKMESSAAQLLTLTSVAITFMAVTIAFNT